MDKVPEKFLNDDGTINSDALIKSYCELERKIGTMIAVPTPDASADVRSKFNRAIGVPETADAYPKNDLFDDDNVREKFLEIGLTSSQVEKIYDIANEFLTPMLSELFAQTNEKNAIGELKKFFGSDEKMRDALLAVQTFGEKFLPADAFDALCSTPDGIRGVYQMMQSMEPTVKTDSGNTEILSDANLRDMMRNPKYWREHDPEYVRKIENGFKKLYS